MADPNQSVNNDNTRNNGNTENSEFNEDRFHSTISPNLEKQIASLEKLTGIFSQFEDNISGLSEQIKNVLNEINVKKEEKTASDVVQKIKEDWEKEKIKIKKQNDISFLSLKKQRIEKKKLLEEEIKSLTIELEKTNLQSRQIEIQNEILEKEREAYKIELETQNEQKGKLQQIINFFDNLSNKFLGISLKNFSILAVFGEAVNTSIKFQSEIAKSRRTLDAFSGTGGEVQRKMAAMGQSAYMTGGQFAELAIKLKENRLQWDKMISIGGKTQTLGTLIGQYKQFTGVSTDAIISIGTALEGIDKGGEQGIVQIIKSVDKVRAGIGLSTNEMETALAMTKDNLVDLYITSDTTGKGLKNAFSTEHIAQFAKTAATLIGTMKQIGISANDTAQMFKNMTSLQGYDSKMFAWQFMGINFQDVVSGKIKTNPEMIVGGLKTAINKLRNIQSPFLKMYMIDALKSILPPSVITKLQNGKLDEALAAMQQPQKDTFSELRKKAKDDFDSLMKSLHSLKENLFLLLSPMIPVIKTVIGGINSFLSGIIKMGKNNAFGGIVSAVTSIGGILGGIKLFKGLFGIRSRKEWISIIREATGGIGSSLSGLAKKMKFFQNIFGKLKGLPNILGKFGTIFQKGGVLSKLMGSMAFRVGGGVAGLAIGGGMMLSDALHAKEEGRSMASGALLGNSVGENAGKWAAIGAGIGTFIAPGVGTLVGGAIGALGGAIAGAYGAQAENHIKAVKSMEEMAKGTFKTQQEKIGYEKIKNAKLQETQNTLIANTIKTNKEVVKHLSNLKEVNEKIASATDVTAEETKMQRKNNEKLISNAELEKLGSGGNTSAILTTLASKNITNLGVQVG